MLATNRTGLEDVIVLTDGGDQGSHPERTIAALNMAGARLLVVGYGDPKIGARVLEGEGDTNSFLVYEGQEVWTKLDEADLQTLAGAATQGKYVHGGTPDFDLGQTYTEWTANAPRKFLHGRSDLKYDEYFGWLLVPALILLLYPFAQLRRGKTILLVMFFAIRPLHATVASNETKPAPAADATATSPALPGEPPFQLGVSLMHQLSFEDAAKAFASATDRAATPEATAVCRYNEALADAALAAHASDPGAQLNSLQAAIAAMRSARLLRPDWLPPAQGLEVLYARHANAVTALKVQQDAQNKLNQQAAELQKELERLLAEQKKLLAAGTQLQRDRVTPDAEKLERLKTLHVQQDELGQQTEMVLGKMNSVRDTMQVLVLKMNAAINPALSADKADAIPTIFDEPLQHLILARAAQDRAVKLLGMLDQVKPAVQAKQQTVNELEATLAALAAGQSSQSDQESEDSDDSDMTDSADSDNAASQSMPVKGDFLSDPVNRSLPQPNFSPADILQEEQANAQTRTKNQPARVGKEEKDW